MMFRGSFFGLYPTIVYTYFLMERYIYLAYIEPVYQVFKNY